MKLWYVSLKNRNFHDKKNYFPLQNHGFISIINHCFLTLNSLFDIFNFMNLANAEYLHNEDIYYDGLALQGLSNHLLDHPTFGAYIIFTLCLILLILHPQSVFD